MAILSRENIESADDGKMTTVEVPEWGGEVGIRTLTGLERESLLASIAGEEDGIGYQGAILVRTICDGDGERLFADDESDQVMAKAATSLHRLYKAAIEWNRLDGGDEEELEKN